MLAMGGISPSTAAHCSRASASEPRQLFRLASSVSSSCRCRLTAPRRHSQWRHTQRVQALPSCRTRPLRCHASAEGGEGGSASNDHAPAESGSPASGNDRLKSTLSGLDAMLGIDPEEERRKKEKENRPEQRAAVSVAPGVFEQLAQAEAARKQGSGTEQEGGNEEEVKISEAMVKIVENAKRIAAKQDGDIKQDEKELQGQFSQLLDMMRPEGYDMVDKEHVDRIKKEAFGPATFYVTETRLGSATDMTNGAVPGGGLLVRGNLRVTESAAFEVADAAVKRMFGERYEVLMIPDVEGEDMGETPGPPRVAFQIMPASAIRPAPATAWQSLFAGTLLLLTFGSCVQLGLAANVHLLPKETLSWLANPQNVDPDILPPGLEGFDAVPYFSAALPIILATFGTQLVHELGHRVAASIRKVKLGPSFLIPNSQIGTFGGVTAFKSMVRTRTDLFDVAVAGPAAGGATALAIFALGLLLSLGGSDAQDALVPVPSQLFQGSLLLGGAVKAVLGDTALNSANVSVHPMLIAGWCGLVSTALNLLPVGAIDGGRILQAAFGRGALAWSSFLTYAGLGFGLLGSSLALPFGLYVLIVQRLAENVVQDNVTEPSHNRKILAAVMLIFSVLVLLPMPPLDGMAEMGSDNLFM